MFWAAYEQAGGLMNLYARDKINRVVMGYEIPNQLLSIAARFLCCTDRWTNGVVMA
jgi:POT family proton-dependent oligopeptide transporter